MKKSNIDAWCLPALVMMCWSWPRWSWMWCWRVLAYILNGERWYSFLIIPCDAYGQATPASSNGHTRGVLNHAHTLHYQRVQRLPHVGRDAALCLGQDVQHHLTIPAQLCGRDSLHLYAAVCQLSKEIYLSISVYLPAFVQRSSLTLSLSRSLIESLIHSPTHSLIHSLTHSLTHSSTHLLTHSLTHSPTH